MALSPKDLVEEIIHIPRKAKPGVIGSELMIAMESSLHDALQVAGDTAPRLMYQLADVDPQALDAFTRHHAEHFMRRTVTGGEAEEVAAVLIRHAFIVGALTTQALAKAGRS